MTIPPSFAHDLSAGRVIPFVGSGVSLSVRPGLFPRWSELLLKMAARLEVNGKAKHAQIVRLFVDTDDLMHAAQVALAQLGKAEFNAVMCECFRVEQPADADLSLPRAIWDLRPSLVVTTNYDSVLEWAHAGASIVLNDQPDELAELYRGTPEQPAVWHLHGHISQAGSLILAPSQYDALYRESPATRTRTRRPCSS